MRSIATRRILAPVTVSVALLASAAAGGNFVAGNGNFVTFESGQVRPLALSPDGSRLFAVDTPDDRLEIFDVTASGLTHSASVPVGIAAFPVTYAPHKRTYAPPHSCLESVSARLNWCLLASHTARGKKPGFQKWGRLNET